VVILVVKFNVFTHTFVFALDTHFSGLNNSVFIVVLMRPKICHQGLNI